MAITMANGSFPISDEHSAHSAWLLRGHSKEYTPEQVEAHIRRACKKLKIAPPGGAVSKSLDEYVSKAWADGDPAKGRRKNVAETAVTAGGAGLIVGGGGAAAGITANRALRRRAQVKRGAAEWQYAMDHPIRVGEVLVKKNLDEYVTIAKDATGAKFAHDMAVGNSASVGKPPKNIKAGEASNKRRRIVIHKPQNFS